MLLNLFCSILARLQSGMLKILTACLILLLTKRSKAARDSDNPYLGYDSRVPIRNVKCYECYETPLTVGSACSRTRYCEGKWCAKEPGSNGVYRGCMHLLPVNVQGDRCIETSNEKGFKGESCYCNSEDFCNAASRHSSSLFIPIAVAVCPVLFRIYRAFQHQ